MTTLRDPIYAGYRYPAELISYAVWLYFRFPLSLRMVEEMLAARGISVTYETIRQWSRKFGREFANRISRRAPRRRRFSNRTKGYGITIRQEVAGVWQPE
jgi:putative transposase